MREIRDGWPAIKHDLRIAAQILESFGLTAVNLPARSVIHPIAYYVKTRNLDDSYLDSVKHADDRAVLRFFVVRSLLRQGIWGSGLDTLLTRLRDAIRRSGLDRFPAGEVELAMAQIGKSLAFNDTDVDALLDLRYGDKLTFALLSLLYPTGETMKRHHVDHVFPRSRFTKSQFAKDALDPGELGRLRALAEKVPNLQLLTPSENESKGDRWPLEWLADEYAGEPRATLVALHQLDGVSDSLVPFEEFAAERKARLRTLLRKRLGIVGDHSVAQ